MSDLKLDKNGNLIVNGKEIALSAIDEVKWQTPEAEFHFPAMESIRFEGLPPVLSGSFTMEVKIQRHPSWSR